VPLVLIGHSAGGQLVLQAIEELAVLDGDDAPDLAISQAGVVDLRAAHDRRMGEGAVAMALGATPQQKPELYAAASPMEFTTRRRAWLLVHGLEDSADHLEMNRRLAARDDLDRPELLTGAGDHFTVIDPASDIWNATVIRAEQILGIAGLPATSN
jgi:hypothetical protein